MDRYAYLPCEIFHREYDAKLLLAVRLAAEKNIHVLIGYDKYFNQLMPSLPAGVLLDKSCSSIMWHGRIQPAIRAGGKVIISDEEGFNNIGNGQEKSFLVRVDLEAVKNIHAYACWGSIDQQFFSQIPELKQKMLLIGNCRADLLGKLGKNFYSAKINALKELYGKFVLCSDNFCVERWNSDYQLPLFNASQHELDEASSEFNNVIAKSKSRRETFANMLECMLIRYPSTYFILRPHPVANPKWWSQRFWRYRNLHVLYHMNVEPWIHAAHCVISMGCTTGLQSLIASRRTIEIVSNESVIESSIVGKAHKYGAICVSTIDQLEQALTLSLDDNDEYISGINGELLTAWIDCNKSVTTVKFASLIAQFSALIPASNMPPSSMLCPLIRKYLLRNKLLISSEKWSSCTHASTANKVTRWANCLNLSSPSITHLGECLTMLSPPMT